ncbi:MAG: DUF3467 domain-containing protein [Bacillota bacterium]
MEEENRLPVYYDNSVNVEASVYDVSITCGIRLSDKKAYDPLSRIIMSPQHAKVLAKILTDTLEQYEKDLGELPMPPEFRKTEN